MKNRIKYILLVLSISFLFCGCGKKNVDIENVINENIKALQSEDVNAYMKTIDKNSVDYDQTKKAVQELFSSYDLNYQINKIEVASVNDDEAKVKVTQVTKKVKGAEFTNNKSVIVHILKKVDGIWKISSTTVQSVEKLN